MIDDIGYEFPTSEIDYGPDEVLYPEWMEEDNYNEPGRFDDWEELEFL